MTWKQKVIDEQYGGDSKRFEEAFADAVVEGRKNVVSWDNLLADATTFPNLKRKGREFIEQYLGYLPGDSVIVPFEPFLRALLNRYYQHQLNEDDFIYQLEEHIKLIRNADVRHNTCPTYDEAIYRNYKKTFAPYGYAVKSRLTQFLGYEPKLEHSLIAEMWIRDVMAHDEILLTPEITPVDWKAITLIRYREVLLKQGQAAADTSPFLMLR